MAWQSLRSDFEVPDTKIQSKDGTRIEQYKVSADALFLPRKQYIPLDSIEKIQIRNSQMNSGNCCGMAFPVYNVIVFYGGERPAKLMLEKKENAQKLADLLLNARETIKWEEYIPPYRKEKENPEAGGA